MPKYENKKSSCLYIYPTEKRSEDHDKLKRPGKTLNMTNRQYTKHKTKKSENFRLFNMNSSKTGGDLRCFGRVDKSCFQCDTKRFDHLGWSLIMCEL